MSAEGPDFAEVIVCPRCVDEGRLTGLVIGIKPGGEWLRVWCGRHRRIVQDYELLDRIDVREW